MKKVLYRIMFGASLLVATCFAVQPAASQTPQVYFGVHGGKSFGNTDLSVENEGSIVNGLGSSGYIGGVHAGVDFQMNKSPLFFGAFGGYDWQNTEFNVANGLAFSAKLGESWYAGGRLGVVLGGSKFYALAAYRQTDLSFTSAMPSLTEALGSPTLKGYDLGLGAEIPLAKNMSLGVEGVWTKYQDQSFEFCDKFTYKPETLNVMARLNISFGGIAGSQGVNLFEEESQGCDPKFGNCKKK